MLLKLVTLIEDWGTIDWLRNLAALRLKDEGFVAWVAKVRRAALMRHCCCHSVGRAIAAIVPGKGNVLSFVFSTLVVEEWVTLKRPRLM